MRIRRLGLTLLVTLAVTGLAAPAAGDHTAPPGQVTLEKQWQVEGDWPGDLDPEDTFGVRFTVSVGGSISGSVGFPGQHWLVEYDTEVAIVEETITTPGFMPDGCAFEDADLSEASFTPTEEHPHGTATVVNVITCEPVATINVTKLVGGEGDAPDGAFTFALVCDGTTIDDDISLADGGSSTPYTSTEGFTDCTVEETDTRAADGVSWAIDGTLVLMGGGTVTDPFTLDPGQTANVHFINRFDPVDDPAPEPPPTPTDGSDGSGEDAEDDEMAEEGGEAETDTEVAGETVASDGSEADVRAEVLEELPRTDTGAGLLAVLGLAAMGFGALVARPRS